MNGKTKKKSFLIKNFKLTFKLKGLNLLKGRQDPIELIK